MLFEKRVEAIRKIYPVGYGLLYQYMSPEHENSYAKGIPNTPTNRFIIRELGKHLKIRVRARGPRKHLIGTPNSGGYKRNKWDVRCSIRISEAQTFAIYPR